MKMATKNVRAGGHLVTLSVISGQMDTAYIARTRPPVTEIKQSKLKSFVYSKSKV